MFAAAVEHVRPEFRFFEFLRGLEGPLAEYFLLIFILLAYGLIAWGTYWLVRSRVRRRNAEVPAEESPSVGVGIWFTGGRGGRD